MPAPSVAIVTDSAAALPHSLQGKYQIGVVPLRLAIDGRTYSEGVNISAPRVVAELMGGKRITVEEPPVEELVNTYRALADQGAHQVLSIHVSSKVHGVVEKAREAAKISPIPVQVIDTQTVAHQQGFIVLAAAATSFQGGNAAAAEFAARNTQEHSTIVFTVDTMDYLHRDGRVPTPIKMISNATKTRPVITFADGDHKLLARVKGTAKAREYVRTYISDYVSEIVRPAVAVALVGGSAADEGLNVVTDGPHYEESPGASLAAHTGPGTYAVSAASMPAEFMIEA